MTSHSPGQIQKFCKRLIWLDNGEIRMDGARDDVVKEYAAYLQWYKTLADSEKADYVGKQYAARCQTPLLNQSAAADEGTGRSS